MIVENFINAVAELPASPAKSVLETLRNLYVVSTILKQLGEFTEDGFLSKQQVAVLRKLNAELLAALRPNAVAIVDAWALSDYELQSALGQHDGDVYNALFNAAQKSELNKTHIGPGYEAYLKHRFQSNL